MSEAGPKAGLTLDFMSSCTQPPIGHNTVSGEDHLVRSQRTPAPLAASYTGTGPRRLFRELRASV